MTYAAAPVDTTANVPSPSTSEPISTATLPNRPHCHKWHHANLTPEQRAAHAIQFVQQRHAVASVGAALVGVGILAARKGTKPHRIAGRVWTGMAVLTSLNAFRMRDSQGRLTWFHGLSAVTLSSAIAGVYFARSKKIARHKKFMGVAFVSAALAGVVAWATPDKTIAWKGSTLTSVQATQA